MRGSPPNFEDDVAFPGSIPAGAGEPNQIARKVITRTGLSPRVRGSLVMPLKQLPHLGSIPAGAGEPQNFHCRVQIERVYPRGCGGADSAPDSVSLDGGLSPRVRGSRPDRLTDLTAHGSIPAGAGEPDYPAPNGSGIRVYPRGCGGALTGWCRAGTCAGSIPAGAGEPLRAWPSVSVGGVYPRGCGGARSGDGVRECDVGLSPRVRGSP